MPKFLHISFLGINSQSMDRPDKRRSSQCRCSVKKGVLKILQVSQKALVLESLFNKVPANQACNFIKIRLQHRCFPLKLAKFLKTLF